MVVMNHLDARTEAYIHHGTLRMIYVGLKAITSSLRATRARIELKSASGVLVQDPSKDLFHI
jgi:hypothetical protein